MGKLETLNSVGNMDPQMKGNINWFITMDKVTLFYCLHYLVKKIVTRTNFHYFYTPVHERLSPVSLFAQRSLTRFNKIAT